MSEKRFFTKINSKGRLVIIDKDCHTELTDMYLACEVLNRLDLKRRVFIEENEQLKEDLEFNMRTEIAHHRVIEQELKEKNEQLKKENKELEEEKEHYADLYNECRRLKLSDNAIKQAYAELNRREREKHCSGDITFTATSHNEVVY